MGLIASNLKKKNISKVCDGRKNPSHTFASLASLAQLVRERVAVNDKVAGSIPAGSVILNHINRNSQLLLILINLSPYKNKVKYIYNE